MKKVTIKVLKISAFATVLLVSLAVLAGAIISYSSRSEWAAEKASLLAKGEKLSFAELVPEAHMDERNFFFDPIWMELINTRPIVSVSGIRSVEPILPKGKRMLDVIDAPISANLHQRTISLFPELAEREKLNIGAVSNAVSAEIPSKGISDRTREIALFVRDFAAESGSLRKRLEELLLRPEAVFPYDPALGFGNSLDNAEYINKLAGMYRMLVAAYFINGDFGSAAREIRHIVVLAQTLRGDPFLYSFVVRQTCVWLELFVIQEGVKNHVWSEDELREFNSLLSEFNFPAEAASVLRAQRGASNQLVEAAMKDGSGVKAWDIEKVTEKFSFVERQIASLTFPLSLATDQPRINKYYQAMIDICEQETAIDPKQFGNFERVSFPWRGFHVASVSMEFVFESLLVRMLSIQDEISRTKIACALESYRQAHGGFPSELPGLVPDFLAALPRSVISGKRFSWEKAKDGKYLLKLTGTEDLAFQIPDLKGN